MRTSSLTEIRNVRYGSSILLIFSFCSNGDCSLFSVCSNGVVSHLNSVKRKESRVPLNIFKCVRGGEFCVCCSRANCVNGFGLSSYSIVLSYPPIYLTGCGVPKTRVSGVTMIGSDLFLKTNACGTRCRCLLFSGGDGMVSSTIAVCGSGRTGLGVCRGFLSGRKQLEGHPKGSRFMCSVGGSSGVSFFRVGGGGVGLVGSLQFGGPRCAPARSNSCDEILFSSGGIVNCVSVNIASGCMCALCAGGGVYSGGACGSLDSAAMLIFS